MKIYHIHVNAENTWLNINYSSTDKGLLEEIICDSFMQDVFEEFNFHAWHTRYPLNFFAKRTWAIVLEYYKDNVSIIETELL